MSTEKRPYTIFVDWDGTIVKHNYTPEFTPDEFLPGAVEMLKAWKEAGHTVVVTTARHGTLEMSKIMTKMHEIIPHCLIAWGLTTGPRVLINDRSPEGATKAFAINVDRDKGIGDVVLE